MADATETYQQRLPRPAGLRLERYLGVAALAMGAVGVLALFGSNEALWDYTRQVLGAFFLLARVVVG